MTTMPYTVKHFKIFFSGTNGPMALKLGMKHQILRYYQDYSNDDPGLTMTVLPQGKPSTNSYDFFSKTSEPIVTKFHIQPPGPLGTKNVTSDQDNMTNMTTTPIYGNKLKNLLQNQ